MSRGPVRSDSILGSIVSLVTMVAIVLGVVFGIQHFLFRLYEIPSGSMEPTVVVGQHVVVNRLGMYIGGPHVGEIAVFHPPQGSEEQVCGPSRRMVEYGKAACSQQGPQENTSINYIKRIVAGPNDEIYIHEGHVFLKEPRKSKFVKEHDSYIKACGGERECDFPTPIRIPPGHWFMMGDNRGESDDSRFWGPVPTSWIIGPAVATYWPPDRIGIF